MRSDADIEAAMTRHGSAVLRACSVYLARHDAEDVFQETFLRYALHDAPFNDDEHAKAWLIRVAINLCKDELRAARRSDSSLDEVEEVSHPPEQEQVGDRMRVRSALEELSPDQRAAVLLTVVEGYTVPEASRIMDKPENTIYSLVRRGKRKLKGVLGHDE